MKASLDTNVIIHFYRANLQHILFLLFSDGVVIYEQIRNIELENHGQDVLKQVDSDISDGKIKMYTDAELKKLEVYRLFEGHVNENKRLYGPGDLGEVYAISLAQTLGAHSLVTDDTKTNGPYMSLLQFGDEVMPFNFVDVLLLRYVLGDENAENTVIAFNKINETSLLNWSLSAKLKKFIRRFWTDSYRKEDTIWINSMLRCRNINPKERLNELMIYL